MSFIFGTETHTFKGRYIGCVPMKVTTSSADRISAGIQMLDFKLNKLHEKLVDEIAHKRHGEGATKANKDKISKQLTKHGRDVRRGDASIIDVKTDFITVRAEFDITVKPTSLPSHTVTTPEVVASPNRGLARLVFIHEGQRVFLHVFEVSAKEVDTHCDALKDASAFARREQDKKREIKRHNSENNFESPDEKSTSALSDGSGDGDCLNSTAANTVSFGIGFKRRSSIRVSAGLRRKGSVSLTGKKKEARRSNTSSSLMTQMSSSSLPSSHAATTTATHHSQDNATSITRDRAISQRRNSFDEEDDTGFGNDDGGDGDGDGDFLDGIDESLFATVDEFNEADAADIDDMDCFGFDDDFGKQQTSSTSNPSEEPTGFDEADEDYFGF